MTAWRAESGPVPAERKLQEGFAVERPGLGDHAEETGRRESEGRGGPPRKGNPMLRADGEQVGSVLGKME